MHKCDKFCQWLAEGQWFSPGTPVPSTNKTDLHDMTEILLKVALNTINHKYAHYVRTNIDMIDMYCGMISDCKHKVIFEDMMVNVG